MVDQPERLEGHAGPGEGNDDPVPDQLYESLQDAAYASPDLPYRNMYLEIRNHDRAEFAQRLSRYLDRADRAGTPVVHLSLSVLDDDGDLLRVAQVVVRVDRHKFAAFQPPQEQ